MKGKALPIFAVLLVVALIAVFAIKASQETTAQKLAAQKQASEDQLLLAAIQYRQNQESIEANKKVSFKDVVEFLGGVGGAISTIYTGGLA